MHDSLARISAVGDDLAAAAARIQSLWESGRVCPHVGRGLRARVVEAGSLAAAGHLPPDDARRIAFEAEGVAVSFGPLRRTS